MYYLGTVFLLLNKVYLHYSVLLSSGILPGSSGVQGLADCTSPLRMLFSADSVFLLLNQTSPLTVNLGKHEHRMVHFKVRYSMLKIPEDVDIFL